MTTPVGTLRERIKEKVCKGVCPFCQSQNWNINSETTQILNVHEMAKLVSGDRYSVRPQDLIKVECNECGYIAYFDYNKVSK